MCLDFSHGFPAVDLLAADWAFVVFQLGNRVSLTFKAAGPLPPKLLDLTAAAGRTPGDFKHGHSSIVLSSMIPEIGTLHRTAAQTPLSSILPCGNAAFQFFKPV